MSIKIKGYDLSESWLVFFCLMFSGVVCFERAYVLSGPQSILIKTIEKSQAHSTGRRPNGQSTSTENNSLAAQQTLLVPKAWALYKSI